MTASCGRFAVTLGAHIVDALGRPVTDIPAGQGRRILEEIRITAAGTAAGTSVDLAKLGVAVRSIGAVGSDPLGAFLIQELRRHGVDTRGLVSLTGIQTGASILPIRPSGDRPALTVRGANARFGAAHIDRSLLRDAAVIHLGAPDVLLGLSSEDLAEIASGARARGATVTMDVLTSGEDGALARLTPALAHVRYFMPNEEQLCSFTGVSDVTEAARRIIALGVEAVVVSRGADGASVITSDSVTDLPAYPAQVLDTTGCGDAVSAGVIAGLIGGWSLIDSARLGLAAASLVTGGLGSDAGIVDLRQTAQVILDSEPGETAERIAGLLAGEPATEPDSVQAPPSYDALRTTPGECPSAWSLFGKGDRVGLLNLQTPARIAAAARLVSSGEMYSLNAPIDAIDPPMYERGAPRLELLVEDDGAAIDDHLDNFYPQGSSQWDSLAHFAYRRGVFFGGAGVADVRAGRAATIDAWAERGIAGRGVLLDIEELLGGAGSGFDPASTRPITVAELDAARERAGARWQPGDVMLLHTGYLEWYLRQDDDVRAEIASAEPCAVGLAHGEEMVRYLWDAHVSAIASDNPALEAWPPGDGEFDCLHRCLIGRFGLAIGEFLALGELARACRARGRYEVFFTAAPLNIPGGVGSTANALAFL
ncbi:MAG TPA: PfkB family carbohydrate kinase [Solirubrobacteraceae bacterium]|jgi:sugar/nucleoside kinase (ribokinase family)/kynurenine formamidase